MRSVLTERGSAFLGAGAYELARRTYERAYKRYRIPVDALALGEALLLTDRAAEVAGSVMLEHQKNPVHRSHGTFLLRVASDGKLADRLFNAYEQLPRGERGVLDASGALRRKYCGP